MNIDTFDISTHFKMDKTIVEAHQTEEDRVSSYWLEQPVEERFLCVEYLRYQWIVMQGLECKMDRTFFEYR